MNKSGGKHFIVILVAICAAVTLMGYGKAEAQWEAEWQKTLAAGKKEGKVVVYGSSFVPALKTQAPIFKLKPQFKGKIVMNGPTIAGERYFVAANSSEKWVMNEQDQYLQLAKDIFGPFIGR